MRTIREAGAEEPQVVGRILVILGQHEVAGVVITAHLGCAYGTESVAVLLRYVAPIVGLTS